MRYFFLSFSVMSLAITPATAPSSDTLVDGPSNIVALLLLLSLSPSPWYHHHNVPNQTSYYSVSIRNSNNLWCIKYCSIRVRFSFSSDSYRSERSTINRTQKKRTNITTTNRGESFIARIGSTENFISYCRRLAMMTTVMFSSLMLQLPLEKHHSSQSN